MNEIALTTDQERAARSQQPRITRIYVLKDPRNGAVRYVGKTMRPIGHRLAEHIRKAAQVDACEYNTRRSRWIRSLLRADIKPTIEQIDIALLDWAEREQHWINQHRAAGADLTNLTNGGEGTFGRKATEEQRARCIDAAKARLSKTGARERISKSLKHYYSKPGARRKKIHSEETRKKIAESVKGICSTEAGRERMRAMAKSQWANEELRNRIVATRNVTLRSEEARARAREKAMAQWARPGALEKLSAALKKRPPQSAEARARAAESNRGRKRSPEACARISAGRLAGIAKRRAAQSSEE